MANTINGMMKVLKRNYLISQSYTPAVSSGSGSFDNLFDLDNSTFWISSGSDDTITETIEVVFDSEQDIDRLILKNMNFKNYTIQYWDGSAYADFTNVFTEECSSIAGASYGVAVYGQSVYANTTGTNGIYEIDNEQTTKYYEFTSVNTLKILLSVTKTITANEEKQMVEYYIGEEVGTFTEDITSVPNTYEQTVSNGSPIYLTKSNGGTVRLQRADKYSSRVRLRELWETNDQNIVYSMFDLQQFVIYPCGAVNYYTQRGWRLQDFYHVIIRGDLQGTFSVGRDSSLGFNQDFTLNEQ